MEHKTETRTCHKTQYNENKNLQQQHYTALHQPVSNAMLANAGF